MDPYVSSMTTEQTTATDAAMSTASVAVRSALPPSVWAGVWVGGALAYLIFARRTWGKLG